MTGIKVIVVSNDPAHASMVMSGLAQSQYSYLVSELTVRDTLNADLALEIEAVRGHYPVIVMLDFHFLLEACEPVVAQIDTLKGDMAIECLVTRPPANKALCDRLRDRGVFLFNAGAELPLAALAVH